MIYLEVMTWAAISGEKKHNAGSIELTFDGPLISAVILVDSIALGW